MTTLHSLGILTAVSVFLMCSAVEARADAVTYQFAGTCVSGSSPGDCGYFGLSDGDAVSGSITLDGTRLDPTGFTTFLPTDPDLDFAFTFGTFSVGKGNLDPNLDIRVMLSDASGAGIILQNAIFACVNALFPCAVLQTGTELLTIGTTFGTASRSTDFGSLPAYTLGNWTIAPAVPEPPATILVALALIGLTWTRRRARWLH